MFSANAYMECPANLHICIVPLGVDVQEMQYIEREWARTLKFLVAGAAQYRKGTWLAIEAFLDAFKRRDKASLTVWSSVKTPELMRLQEEYGVHKKITFDTSDVVSGASAAEYAANTVHSIEEFYQPYSSDPSNSQYVSMEIAGQDLTDPTTTSVAGGYYNFADTPLFVEGPEYNDVAQGSVGDCYYLAALAGLADTDPEIISQMIAPLGDGTFAVRYFESGQEVYLRIDADLPVRYGTRLAYAKLGVDGELWMPLLEKAYAFFRYGQNSYASLSGGWMATPFRRATGGTAVFKMTSGPAESLYTYIEDQLAQGHSVTAGSRSSSPSPIVGSHAYSVRSLDTVDGQMYVTVYNPWGTDGRNWDSDSYDGILRVPIELFQEAFVALVTSYA